MKLVGICGISGSGKTYLLQRILQEFEQGEASSLSFDNYYKPAQLQLKDEKGHLNFDLPQGVDHHKLLYDLEQLRKGNPITISQYNFNQANIPNQKIEVKPAPIVLVEGIFVFHFQELFQQLDYKIFVETDLQTTFQRRLQRDFEDRGIDKEFIFYQWHQHVIPGYQKFLLPYKAKADLVLKNEGNELENQLPKLKDLILSLKAK